MFVPSEPVLALSLAAQEPQPELFQPQSEPDTLASLACSTCSQALAQPAQQC